jgi:transaldolase
MDVRGVTTNPTIFEKAISSGSAAYADQIAQLTRDGASVDQVIRALTTDDVRAACDLFLPVWESTAGSDGRVSLEVDPRLARDTEGTIAQAKELWSIVDRPNLLIKIPATVEGLPAITEVIASGISVNVTLIFSVARYRAVLDAYAQGVELALSRGLDLSTIHSVASFFVSRVDTEVDKRLSTMNTPEAAALRGKAAIANADLAWAACEAFIATDRWKVLAAAGATAQRPLWASTGVKDPSFDDTRYVIELVAPGVVNTMPEATLDAVADHGVFRGDTMSGTFEEASRVWLDLEGLGIEPASVFTTLEDEGVEKFIASWNDLISTVSAAMDKS